MRMNPYAFWNFGNSTINTEGVKFSREKQFMLCCTFVRQRHTTYNVWD